MRKKKSSSSSSSSSQMDAGDRQHRSTNGGGSELFICFTSRPSAAEAPSLSASLSRRLRTSGSVKGAQSPMFSNVVGGRRNKGAAFETAEPTSPKVTCIGQVRVKGKQRRKKAKGAMMVRSRSKRVVGTEVSFRREGEMGRERERECMPGARNQGSWVYQIPVSICDALKAVGSEFNCLLPCSGKSFCSSSSGPKGTGEEGKVKRRGSCGAVLARWLMMQENEEVKREVEEELEREEQMVEMERKVEVVTDWEERRMVEEFEVEIRKKDEILVVGEGEEGEGEEKGRVSVCIPPKNALLLMRCRSDPVRMAALANRLWGSPVRKVHAQEEEVEEREEEEEEEEERDCGGENKAAIVGEDEGERVCEASVSEETVSEAERADLKEIQAEVCEQNTVSDSKLEEKEDLDEPTKESFEQNVDPPCSNETEKEKDCNSTCTESQAHSDPIELTKEETTEAQIAKEEKQSNETKARRSTSCSPSRAEEEKKQRQYRMRRQRSNGGGGSSSREKDSRRHSFSSEGDPRRSSFSSVKDGRRSSFSIEGRRWSFSIEQEDIVIAKQSEVSKGKKKSKACSPETEQVENGGDKEGDKRTEEKEKEKTEEKMERKLEMIATERKKSGELPDCLLLMMYEPKLSMEVSRETWVRPTDFINWRAHKRQNPPPKTEETKAEETKTEETDEQKKDTQKVTWAEETADPEVEMLPAVQPVVKGGNEEKNRVKIELPAEVLYAPFVLKRCKSEPMRASARLVADACFWKERHRPIGAVGF
ncbi:hypothetical protein LUZ60_012617 [Juncus effusus]|nr:hypothetical protein LUZ60_012617 [Juncus effusus]